MIEETNRTEEVQSGENDNFPKEHQEKEIINYVDKKKCVQKIWTPLYLAIAFLLGIAVAVYLLPAKQSSFSNKQLQKFNEVFQYINMYYVDTVNTDKLFEEAINGMLQSLDPHSTYVNAAENKSLMESLDGAFEGIGVQFSIMNDTVMVVAIVSGGPSEKVGLRAGDRIVTVDGKKFAGVGIQNEDVMKSLRGKKNSKVDVGIKRQGFKQIYHYKITRDVIPTYTVDVSYMIDNQSGYVKINQFGSTTGDEFANALKKLNSMGMKKLILDLRGNPGGYLEAAIRVCDELLSDGEMIVYTEGLRVKKDKIYATEYGNFEKGEVVVLIDDFSASASEIVAGAVQDNDRGLVVGRRSFGKGLVQRQFDLNDKSTIRLTTSRYHTPSGRCIQKDYKNGSVAYEEELVKRYENGEMDSTENITFDKSLKYKTKKGRTVYGGGGIMPDYFVPLDRDEDLFAFYQILNSTSIIEFAFDYSTKNQQTMKTKYPDAKSFVKNMTVSDRLLNRLLNFYTAKTGQQVVTINAASKKELKVWIKALIGRNLYQEEAFYPVINSTDKVILKALEIK
jgi:carboxyl-terminal processing protease